MRSLKCNQNSQQRLAFEVICMEATAETEQRCGSLGRTGVRTFVICTFKGQEKIVSCGKAGKMGVKPGQDGKKIKIKDNPSFLPMTVWLLGGRL